MSDIRKALDTLARLEAEANVSDSYSDLESTVHPLDVFPYMRRVIEAATILRNFDRNGGSDYSIRTDHTATLDAALAALADHVNGSTD